MATAWLQLLWAPRNVKATPVERTAMLPGELLALEEGGRSLGSEGELRLQARGVAKLHCRIHFRDGQWRLFHYGYSFSTLVNGVPRLEWVLSHRDVVEIPFGPVFRFLLREEGQGTEQMAQALAEEPASPERLAVWADHLIERGSSLGERIQAALRGEPESPEEARRWLGPLARVEQEARLDLSWKGGMLESAALRDVLPSGTEPLAMVTQLMKLEVARTLKSLWLDSAGMRANVTAFVAALEYAGPQPALRQLCLGDCHVNEQWLAGAELEVRPKLEKLYPRLEPGPLFNVFRRARLKVLVPLASSNLRPGDEIMLDAAETELVDTRTGEAESGGRLNFIEVWRIRAEHSRRYRVTASYGSLVRVNGKTVNRAALRNGDHVQMGQGQFRFELID